MKKIIIFIILVLGYFAQKLYAQGIDNTDQTIVAIVNDTIFTRYDLVQRKAILQNKIINNAQNFDVKDEEILDLMILEELYDNFLSTNSINIEKNDAIKKSKILFNLLKEKQGAEANISLNALEKFIKGKNINQQIQILLVQQIQSNAQRKLHDKLALTIGQDTKFLSFKTFDSGSDAVQIQNFKKLHKTIVNLSNKNKNKLMEEFLKYEKFAIIELVNANSLSLPPRQRTIVNDSKEHSCSSIFYNDDGQFEFVLIYKNQLYYNKEKVFSIHNKIFQEIWLLAKEELDTNLKNQAFIQKF